MMIARHLIVDTLQAQGRHEQATRAEQELPETVDTDAASSQLEGYGLSKRELEFKLSGEFDTK
jgi:hypothetical protein